MAKNDFFVIAYRILAYLYQCMKDGAEPDLDAVSYERLGIPQRYWFSVISNLLADGYIRGITIREALGGVMLYNAYAPEITISGIQFLEENSAMSRARNFLKELKEMVPGL